MNSNEEADLEKVGLKGSCLFPFGPFNKSLFSTSAKPNGAVFTAGSNNTQDVLSFTMKGWMLALL